MSTLPGPFTHPAAWRGEELFTRHDWNGSLTDLSAIQRNLEEGCGACLIQGFDIDTMTGEQAKSNFLKIVSQIGTPVSQSAKGEIIFSVRDEGYRVGQPQARGPNTRKRLSFHTDLCDVIAFLCLRQARTGGANQIVSSMSVYNQIREERPDLAEILTRPFYYQRHNVDTGNAKLWCRQPIFSCCDGHFAGSYLRVLIDRAYDSPDLPNMSDEEKEALDFIEEVASRPEMHVTFTLRSGDLLLLNNWVTFHRRDEFEDDPGADNRRHLLRAWLSVPNSRPLVPEFKDNYGSTEAGAIRGGMQAIS